MDSIKLFIVIFILSISSIGGYYYYKEYTKQNSVSPTIPQPVIPPTTQPVTTPNTSSNTPIPSTTSSLL